MLWCLGDAVDGPSARPPNLTVACVKAINDVCTVKLAGNHRRRHAREAQDADAVDGRRLDEIDAAFLGRLPNLTG